MHKNLHLKITHRSGFESLEVYHRYMYHPEVKIITELAESAAGNSLTQSAIDKAVKEFVLWLRVDI